MVGGAFEFVAEPGNVAMGRGQVDARLGPEPEAEHAGKERRGQVPPVGEGEGRQQDPARLVFEEVGVVPQGHERPMESGVVPEDGAEEGEQLVADGIAAVLGVGVGAILAPVGDAAGEQVLHQILAAGSEKGTDQENRADAPTGAQADEARCVGAARQAEEDILHGVVGVVAQGHGVTWLADLVPQLETAAPGGGLDTLAGTREIGDGHAMEHEGDAPFHAELAAPFGVGVGVSAAQAVVDVMGREGDAEFAQQQQQGGAVRPAAKADEEAGNAFQAAVCGEEGGDATGQLAGVGHGLLGSPWLDCGRKGPTASRPM